MAQQIAGWAEPKYTVDLRMDRRRPVFTATASILGGEHVTGPSYRACNQKTAKQYAAVGLLARMYDLPTPEFKLPEPEKPVVVAIKHPVSILAEWCQANKKPAPEYTYVQEGPTHASTFTCTARASGVERQGKAGSKADAKTIAATALVGALLTVGSAVQSPA